MRVLILGEAHVADGRYPADAERHVADSLAHPEGWQEFDYQFDMIILANHLCRLDREAVLEELRAAKELLAKPLGEIIAITPSLEWAAQEIGFHDELPMPAYVALYGTRKDPRRSAFTLYWLRLAMEQAGIDVRKASQEMITLISADGEKVPSWQNVCYGVVHLVEEIG